LIGVGVPHDLATHMVSDELTALYGLDHARSLAIVQPSLLRNQLAVKKNYPPARINLLFAWAEFSYSTDSYKVLLNTTKASTLNNNAFLIIST